MSRNFNQPTRFIPLAGTLKRGTFSPNFGVCVEKVSQQGYVFFCFWCVCVPRKASHKKKEGGGHFWWNFRMVKIQVFIHPEWYKGRSYLCDVTLYAYKVFQRGEISKLVFFDYHTVKQLRCLISLYPSLCTGEKGRNIGTSNSYYLYLI